MSKTNHPRRALAASILWVGLLIVDVPRTLAAPGDIYYLGTFPGSPDDGFSFGYEVSNAGQVTGYATATTSYGYHAVLYSGIPGSGGTMIDLTNLGGGMVINHTGQLAGVNATTGHVFIYTGTPGSGGAMVDLGKLGGSFNSVQSVNSSGQVTGSFALGSQIDHAFLYTGTPGHGGQLVDLGVLDGASGGSSGRRINASGQVTGGSSTVNSAQHAFLYTGTPGSGGKMVDIGTLGGVNGNDSSGYGINDAGQVVGQSDTSNHTSVHAFLYSGTPGSGGIMHDLGRLATQSELSGTVTSGARAINNGGDVVGASGNKAFLYTGTPGVDGHMIDLNDWLKATNPAEAAKWTLDVARDISDTGLITGNGWYNDGPGGLIDGYRAFLLDASSIARAYAADFNLDGRVNFADLLVLAQHYGTKTGATLQLGDANGDGAVDFSDLLLLSQEYQQAAGQAAVSSVPEPALTAAVLLPAATLLARRRRRLGLKAVE